MNKLIIHITGLHCRSCEMLVEDKLSEIPEISKAKVNYKNGTAEIFYDSQKPNDQEVTDAIRSAGYDVGMADKKSFFNQNSNDYKDLGIAFLFLVGIYFVAKNFGLTNLSFGSANGNPESLWVVLLIGLTAGISTCMALVGGLVLGAATRHAEKHPEATAIQKFMPHVYFNLGRIIGFALLGWMLGSVGSFFQISTLVLGALTIFVGLVMLIMGLQLIEIFPWINGLKITLPKFISRMLGIKKHEQEYSHKSSAILGAMTFFLPCGFTQAMQLYAVSTGSPLTGALVMGTFALGTAPGLLGIGGITAAVKGMFAKRFFKLAGLLVIFFALFNISNGYNLTGWQWGSDSVFSGNTGISDPNVKQENGAQVVKMKQLAGGYAPNKFTIKKDIPVKWVITSEEPYSCASSLVISKLGISKKLVRGENIIEFTPTESGALKFSCSMGMYTGVFNVVDEKGNGASSADIKSAAKPSGGSCGMSGGGGCGGCGGGGGAQIKKDVTDTVAEILGDAQIINATYTASNYLQPNSFKVKAGTKVKFTIDVKDSGRGCGYAIMVPGLYNNAIPLQADQSIAMEFTPTTPGSFDITCGMGMINYGTIVVE